MLTNPIYLALIFLSYVLGTIRCNHYFCEKCALKRYAKTPKCAACQTPTGGLFNAVPKDFLKKVAERKAKIEDAARRRAEDDAANAAGSAGGQQGDEEGDSGMVEDLSVVGMGGAPIGGSDDSDDDSDSD
jgi:RING finger protein 113A